MSFGIRNFTVLCVLLGLTAFGCRKERTEMPPANPPASSNEQADRGVEKEVTGSAGSDEQADRGVEKEATGSTGSNEQANRGEIFQEKESITHITLEKKDLIPLDPEVFTQTYGEKCLASHPYPNIQLPDEDQASLDQFLKDSILRYSYPVECSQYALDKGADPDVKIQDANCRISLTLAPNLSTGRYKFDECINSSYSYDSTALQYILERWSNGIHGHGDSRNVKALIEAGADVNLAIRDGRTPLILLMMAIQRHRSDIFLPADTDYLPSFVSHYVNLGEYLVRAAGVDVNATTHSGWTALMYAAQSCEFDAVKYLIEAGADVNAANRNETTALMMARGRAERYFSNLSDNNRNRLFFNRCSDVVGILSLHSNQ